MSKIVTDMPKINLLKSAIAVIFPNGKIIAIEKIPGFYYHIEYLKLLYRENKEIKNILSNVNFKYYIENPSEVIFDIIPLFAQNNCTIYINLSPHIINPTDAAMIFLDESPSKQVRSTISNMKEKFAPILFYNIARYNSETQFFDTYLEDAPLEANSEILYDTLNCISDIKKKNI